MTLPSGSVVFGRRYDAAEIADPPERSAPLASTLKVGSWTSLLPSFADPTAVPGTFVASAQRGGVRQLAAG